MANPDTSWRRLWGGAHAMLHRVRRFSWIDLLIIVGLGGLLYGLIDVESQWTRPRRLAVEIDLSPWALPQYTLLSLARGLIAYVISLSFTLVYGYWAAKDKVAARILIPLLDILQSIPVLAFLPGLLLALSNAFQGSNIGLELGRDSDDLHRPGVEHDVQLLLLAAIGAGGSAGGSNAVSVQLVAAAEVGGVALLHDGAGVEQHDEHGGGLVLFDDQRIVPVGRR